MNPHYEIILKDGRRLRFNCLCNLVKPYSDTGKLLTFVSNREGVQRTLAIIPIKNIMYIEVIEEQEDVKNEG